MFRECVFREGSYWVNRLLQSRVWEKSSWLEKLDFSMSADCRSRMNLAMQRLQKMKSDEYSGFVRVLFGLTTPSPVSEDLSEVQAVEWTDLSLNDSQKHAIKFALASKEIALIHGPPGVSY